MSMHAERQYNEKNMVHTIHTNREVDHKKARVCIRLVVRAAEVGKMNAKEQLMIFAYCRLCRTFKY